MANSSSRPGSPALPSADRRSLVPMPAPRDADQAVNTEPRGHALRAGVAWFAVFVAAFTLYAATANRGAQWQDSGYHILRMVTKEPVNPLGLALSHPLHHWLGRLAVWPNPLDPK